MIRTTALVGWCCLFSIALDAQSARTNAAAFEMLRPLVGTWEGTYQWSGGSDRSGSLRVTYAFTGNGTALVETWIVSGQATMTSVYHRDGQDLRMTHYCAADNQPRLKATRVNEASDTIEFGFVDVTNVAPGRASYVQGATLHYPDPNRLELKLAFGNATGVTAYETLSLTRVK